MFENQSKVNIFDVITIKSFFQNKFIQKTYDFHQNDFKLPKDLKYKIKEITMPILRQRKMKCENIVRIKKQLCDHLNEEQARSILVLFKLQSKLLFLCFLSKFL